MPVSEDTSQLRVLVVSLMREHGGTGLQTHVRTYRDHLVSHGVPVEVVTPFIGPSATRNTVLGVRLGLAAVSGTASVWWYRRWHAHYLERAVRNRLAIPYDGPTVVYAQCPVSADVALRVRTDEPVVLAAHLNGSQADEWAGKGLIAPDGSLFAAIRSLEERVLPRLDGIVHVSEHGRRSLEDRVSGTPSVVLPNFVDPLPPRSLDPAGDLVTVGALEPRKDQGYLLEVLAEAARLGARPSLTVVGVGPDRRRLERLAARLGVAGQVRFVGHVDDVRTLVAGHRLYFHAAREESFGLALLEALAEGVPVLAGAVGGVPELVRDGVDGTFWPLDDPAAAARVLVDLLGDPARLAALGTAGREHARTAYATEVVAPRLTAFLTSRAALASVP